MNVVCGSHDVSEHGALRNHVLAVVHGRNDVEVLELVSR
jgi:hypothetical protein